MRYKRNLGSNYGLSFIEVLIGIVVLVGVIGAGYMVIRSSSLQITAEVNQSKITQGINTIKSRLWDVAGKVCTQREGQFEEGNCFDDPNMAGVYLVDYQPQYLERTDLPEDERPKNAYEWTYYHPTQLSPDPKTTDSAYLTSKFRFDVVVGDIQLPENWRPATITAHWKEGAHDKMRTETFYLTKTRITDDSYRLMVRILNGYRKFDAPVTDRGEFGVDGITILATSKRDPSKVYAARTNSDGIALIYGIDIAKGEESERYVIDIKGDEKAPPHFYLRNRTQVYRSRFYGRYEIEFAKGSEKEITLMGMRDHMPFGAGSVPADATNDPNIKAIYMWPYGQLNGSMRNIRGSTLLNNVGIALKPVFVETKAERKVDDNAPITRGINTNPIYEKTKRQANNDNVVEDGQFRFNNVLPGLYQLVAIGSVEDPKAGDTTPYIQSPDTRDATPNDNTLWLVEDGTSRARWSDEGNRTYAALGRLSDTSDSVIVRGNGQLELSGYADYIGKFIRIRPGETYDSRITNQHTGSHQHDDGYSVTNHNRVTNDKLNTSLYSIQMGDLQVAVGAGNWNNGRYELSRLPGGQPRLTVNAARDPRIVFPSDPQAAPTGTSVPFVPSNPIGYSMGPTYSFQEPFKTIKFTELPLGQVIRGVLLDNNGRGRFKNFFMPIFDTKHTGRPPSSANQFSMRGRFEVFPGPVDRNSALAPVMILTNPRNQNHQFFVAYTGFRGKELGATYFHTVIPSKTVYTGYGIDGFGINMNNSGYEDWENNYDTLIRPFMGSTDDISFTFRWLRKADLVNVKGKIVDGANSPWKLNGVNRTGDVYTWGITMPSDAGNTTRESFLNWYYSRPSYYARNGDHEYDMAYNGEFRVLPSFGPNNPVSTYEGNTRWLRFIVNEDVPPLPRRFWGTVLVHSKRFVSAEEAPLPFLETEYDTFDDIPFQATLANGTEVWTNQFADPESVTSYEGPNSPTAFFRIRNSQSVPVQRRHEGSLQLTREEAFPVIPKEVTGKNIMVNAGVDKTFDLFVRVMPGDPNFVDGRAYNATILGNRAYPCEVGEQNTPACALFADKVPDTDPYYSIQTRMDVYRRLNANRIEGVVMDQTCSNPIPGARVRIYTSSVSGLPENNKNVFNTPTVDIRVGADGAFSVAHRDGNNLKFDAIPGVNYRVRLSATNFVSLNRDVESYQGHNINLGNICLRSAGGGEGDEGPPGP